MNFSAKERSLPQFQSMCWMHPSMRPRLRKAKLLSAARLPVV